MNSKVINDIKGNNHAPFVINNIAQWHLDRNLIEGATTWTQSKKLLEEYIELIAAQMVEQSPDAISQQVHRWVDDLLVAGRIKTVAVEDAQAALKDSLGDQGVVAINIAEREGYSYTDALATSYSEIEHRKGRMVDGLYVKEEDLKD